MAKKCKECGAVLSSFNVGKLCWPCQEKKQEELERQIDNIHYTPDDLCILLGFTNPSL